MHLFYQVLDSNLLHNSCIIPSDLTCSFLEVPGIRVSYIRCSPFPTDPQLLCIVVPVTLWLLLWEYDCFAHLLIQTDLFRIGISVKSTVLFCQGFVGFFLLIVLASSRVALPVLAVISFDDASCKLSISLFRIAETHRLQFPDRGSGYLLPLIFSFRHHPLSQVSIFLFSRRVNPSGFSSIRCFFPSTSLMTLFPKSLGVDFYRSISGSLLTPTWYFTINVPRLFVLTVQSVLSRFPYFLFQKVFLFSRFGIVQTW